MTTHILRRGNPATFTNWGAAEGYYHVAYENLCHTCRDNRDRWIHDWNKGGRSRQLAGERPPDACEACTDASKARAFRQAATGPAEPTLPAVRTDPAKRARYVIVPENNPSATPILVTEDDDIAFRPEGVVVNGRLHRFAP